jgi:nitrogen fixation protein NifU and related proteins
MAAGYSDKVMDHFAHPRNVGVIEDASGVGKVGNPVCGDVMELFIKVDGGKLTDVKFRTFGCGAAIATSSMVTEMVKGRTIDEALKITNKAVADALDGLPAVKMHCSVLAEDALKAAIDDYLKKTTGKGLPGFKPHEEDHCAAH